MQVYPVQSCRSPHPQNPVTGYTTSQRAIYTPTTLASERVEHLSCCRIVRLYVIIRTYPQQIVQPVVKQHTDKRLGQSGFLCGQNRMKRFIGRIASVHPSKPATPRTDIDAAFSIRNQRTYRIMAQTRRSGSGVMFKVLLACPTEIQPFLNGSYPQ